MTDITHEALMERGFDRLNEWQYIKGVILVDYMSEMKVFVESELDFLAVPNCRTLTDLDNLIKLFV